MAHKINPPFRADHVGSLLRPSLLLEARADHAAGELSDDQLRAVEDESITEAVTLQEDVGLQGITDGEYRRAFFHTDFLQRIKGVALKGAFRPNSTAPGAMWISHPPSWWWKAGWNAPRGSISMILIFLNPTLPAPPKICIPSPSMVHFRGGRGAVDKVSYPEMDEFFADLARVYREEVADLADHGCTYLQLDDTNLAYLCDPKLREGARALGEDPDKLPHMYADLINQSIKSRGDDMTVGIHLCRGNFQSAWVAEGGYDPVAEVLFNEVNVDCYFLEYDDPRSGDFAPLRFAPEGKTVVLGLLTTKLPELETKDDIKRRIDEAGKYVPLERLCLSPQCGFSSTHHGNDITVEDQLAKLRHVVEIAGEVWGTG